MGVACLPCDLFRAKRGGPVGDFLSDVHFADLVYFGSAHSTYCACANAMCFLRVFGGNYSI